ncbi:hypothetical protein EMPG_10516 [Blastomyces silverae]|uniref:Actin-like ATPase domain-containing protein n=1 Tax=Blastomyces silverae TaxID=2060906 RepID=A0A0H1B4Y8_9EURO|nr:hypothetical protein EMPG_10516 [Blastomyces silverae]
MRPSWSIIRIILTFTAYAVDAVDATGHTCPRPLCSTCLTPEEVHAVGIGFDLSSSYGTAVIRYHNGSLVNVAKVDAPQAYKSLMKRLSESQRGALQSRFDRVWDELGPLGEPSQRRLQASSDDSLDISALSVLIFELKAQTEALLGHSIRSVAISSPDYVQLSASEISQVIEPLGLKNLASQHELSLSSSEYAGYSSGFLTIPTTVDHCEEITEKRTETILHLDYTETTLSGSISNLQDTTLHHTENVFSDWHLGLSKKPGFTEEEAYWDLLWRRITGHVQESDQKITKLIITGDAAVASNSRFVKEARNALRKFVEPAALRVLDDNPDPVFMAAKGAAEFAKRTQENPRDCVESERCRSLRR